MSVSTNSYPFAFAHFFKRNLDRNQCQVMDNATQHRATTRIITFVLPLMTIWPNVKVSHRGQPPLTFDLSVSQPAGPGWLHRRQHHVLAWDTTTRIDKTTKTQRITDRPAQMRLGHLPTNMPRRPEYPPRTNKQRPTTTRPGSSPKPGAQQRAAKAATHPRAAYPNHLSLWRACVMPNSIINLHFVHGIVHDGLL